MQLNTLLQEQRLKTIFENPNVFAGAAGAAILLSLGLAAGAEDRKERCLHLSCPVSYTHLDVYKRQG